MICDKCNKELNFKIIEDCKKLGCPNKEPVNTSGKVNTLFNVSGFGFQVEIKYLSGDGISK